MATEQQRQALVALRDALEACEAANVLISAREGEIDGRFRQEIAVGDRYYYLHDGFLSVEAVSDVLRDA